MGGADTQFETFFPAGSSCLSERNLSLNYCTERQTMQDTPVEHEQASGSPNALPTPITGRKKRWCLPHLRLFLSVSKGAILLILTIILFSNGHRIIAQNARQLGFYVLNFDVPLPFLLIGLWGLAVLVLTVLTLATMVTICRLLAPSLPRLVQMRRKAA